MVRAHPPRHLAGQPRAAGQPRQPLRGRRLRHLGRQATAHRGRVGARGGRRRAGRWRACRQPRRHLDVPPASSSRRRRVRPGPAAPGLRRLLGVDVLGLPRLPRLPPARRRHRGVQRQVHVRPDGAPRRLRAHPARARARDLPQLLPAGLPLGALRRPARRRRRARRRPDDRPRADRLGAAGAGLGAGLAGRRRPSRTGQPAPHADPEVALRRRRLPAVRRDHHPARTTTRPRPSARSCATTPPTSRPPPTRAR